MVPCFYLISPSIYFFLLQHPGIITSPGTISQATMDFQSTPADVSVIVSTPSSAGANVEPGLHAERRVTPTWTVMQLKSKLETMTGIPPGSQNLRFKAPGRPDRWIEGDDRIVGDWGLIKGCEIEVCALSPLITPLYSLLPGLLVCGYQICPCIFYLRNSSSGNSPFLQRLNVNLRCLLVLVLQLSRVLDMLC